MTAIVLDASAILANINGEPGSEKLTRDLMEASVASAVNIAEVQAKLILRGMDLAAAWEAARTSVRTIMDFDATQARRSADLVLHTKSSGLSLGDRACIALALTLDSPIYTTDKSWKHLRLSVGVNLLR